MLKFLISSSFLLLVFSGSCAAAINCISNCGNTYTNISENFSSSENTPGSTKDSSSVSFSSHILYTSGSRAMQWLKYAGEEVPAPYTVTRNWTYRKVDDYISVALRRTSPCMGGADGYAYAPFNDYIYNTSTCEPLEPNPGREGDFGSSFQSRIRIDKKIVNGTYSKNILVATFGMCQPEGCQSSQYKRDVYLDLNITVPQSCELNAGQVIDINFGNISSGAFKTAGGEAQGVTPQSRSVSVKCDNIAGNAQLDLRLQADKTNGNIVVSDENNDVGFRVTNNSGVPLIPNNLSSVIPFTLDSNARQNVTIQTYPVSVTGNKPTEGSVTSRAYLRVDFP